MYFKDLHCTRQYNGQHVLTTVHRDYLSFFSQLVNTGVLTTRDVGSWWLSVPGAGIFMKNFSNGKVTFFYLPSSHDCVLSELLCSVLQVEVD